MIKMFRAAGFAAVAFLCSANGAAAFQVVKVASTGTETGPVAETVAVSAVAPVLNAAPAAAPAAVMTLAPTPVPAAEAPSFLRARPDRPVADAPVAQRPVTGVASAAAVSRPLVDLVAEHSNATITGEEFECLASTVYYESRGEPLEGQLAVAEVVLNRVRSGRFRGTICDVVRQPSQFSFVRRGVIPSAPRESAAWARSVAIAHIALNNLADVTGDDSLFFHATYVRPNWGRPRIAQIGRHIFYR